MANSIGQVGLPPIQVQPLGYTGSSLNYIPVVSAARAPTSLDVNYPTGCEWIDSSTQDFWKLHGFINGAANWKLEATGSVPGGTVVTLSDTAGTLVSPTAGGNIQLTAGTGVTIVSTPASNLLTISLTGGGIAIDQIAVQAITAPGVTPVDPTAAGLLTINGAAVAAHSVPIETHSRALNTLNVEVQRAAATAGTDAVAQGIASFNSTQFSVDASGFVSLVGGAGPAANTFDTDSVGDVTPVLGVVKVYGQSGTIGATSGIQVTTDAADTMLVRMLTPYTQGDFAFNSTTGGTTRTLTVQNTVDAASSQATVNTAVAGATSGDVWNQWTNGAVRSYSLGIDNSDTNDSLKFTTDSDGTVDPSSGTFLGAINPATGGLEWGPDANGTSSTSKIVSVEKDQDGSTTIGVANSSAGASAFSGVLFSNDNTFATITVPSSGNSVPQVRNTVFINAAQAGMAGIVYGVNSGGFNRWYNNVAGGSLLADLDPNGFTIPVQPSFRAYLSAGATNVTGNATAYTVAFNTEVANSDRNNDYDTGTYTFTAPVTGMYSFVCNLFSSAHTAAGTSYSLNFVNSAGTVIQYAQLFNPTAMFEGGASGNMCTTSTAMIQMTAADTCKVIFTVNGEGGDIIDISGGATLSTFSGWLMG